ncbi:hypothetical protein KDN32_14360 [Nocardioides sp. J2M5]|uniref:hypothetical protein n=1 Tax=Nocardioides palaemonis TaxID=2829810 RepID=UPI001BAB605C|nr:hypothetical protein [Nocardioides palaemonis]MBS2938920.1 hypothetical protein [Nocardioides palaemonis]
MLRAPVPDEMVWASVTRPQVPLVYLDLNQYIPLANASRAQAGHSAEDGRPIRVLPGYPELLDAARRAKAERRALFPLSSVHFTEVAHSIPAPRQRGHLADVMEEFSDFTYLVGRPFLATMEMAAGLDAIYGCPRSYAPMPLLHPSAMAAFGRNGGVRFVSQATGEDIGEEVRRELGDVEYERQVTEMNHFMERRLLEGPQDSEVPALRANGYAPETHADGMQKRLDFELETQAKLAAHPALRRSRLRDVVFAREVEHEWMTLFALHLQERETDGLPHRMPEPGELVALFAAMPQLQVAVSMKARYHRNPAHRWKTNHIGDIDALALAYAYCDAVLTDREARAALAESRDLSGFGADLPNGVAAMTDWLDALPSAADPETQVAHPRPVAE